MPNLDPQLLSALSDPAFVSMDDASVAAAMNAPIYTPRQGWVTFATLSSSDVWGTEKADTFLAALKAVAPVSKEAGGALALITSTGFLAADSQADAKAQALVGIPDSGITSDDAKLALNTISYRCGRNDVTADEVTAGRAYLAQQVVYQQWKTFYDAGVSRIDAAVNAGSTLPTLDQLKVG